MLRDNEVFPIAACMHMKDYKDGLNDKQLAAATTDAANCVVVAGAGTGKTKTMAARVCHLLSNGVQPERILAITFTRRAAAELVSRIVATAGHDLGSRVQACTFHSWCSRLIRADRTQSYTIIDPEDVKDMMSLARGKRDRLFPDSKMLASTYSYCRNSGMKLGEYLERFSSKHAIYLDQFKEIFKGYEEQKRTQNLLDLDDVLAIIASNLADPEYVKTVAALYSDILVDEMQDTNPLQWKLLQPLIGHVRLFCVGDDAQSIFGFRGSDYRFLHDFTTLVPGAIRMTLDQNYRSPHEFLAVSNWLLNQSEIDYDKQLWSERAGTMPISHVFADQMQEAEFIAEKIQADHSSGIPYRNNLILFRSSIWKKFLDAALVKRHIPTEYVGGTTFMRATHVRDLMSPIRILHNIEDGLSWIRFLQIFPGVGSESSSEMTVQLGRAGDMNGKLAILGSGGRKFQEPARVMFQIVGLLNKPLPELIEDVATLLDDLMERRYKEEWYGRKKDVPLLQALAEQEASIASFIENYSMNPVIEVSHDGIEPISDKVTVSTVHGAKGAEADIVYVPALMPGHYPPPSAETAEELEEERRILYVALTRAKRELHLTRPIDRGMTYGRRPDGDEAFFLQDMPVALVAGEFHVIRAPQMPQLNTRINVREIGIQF